MKSLVWQFLNSKFEGIVIYRRLWDLADKRKEEFFTKHFELGNEDLNMNMTPEIKGAGIAQFTTFHNGKEVRYRVNSFLRRDIKSYFDIHEIDVDMYVLEWCRDKAIDTDETEII
jgi:hypothetical protein